VIRLVSLALAITGLTFLSGAAPAQDRDACAAGMVCASSPDTVQRALEKAGLKPSKSVDNDGDPMLRSEEGTYPFNVYFYGCEQHRNCDSLRFEVLFRKESDNTPELANRWNAGQRFLQAAVKPDGRMVVAYDLATIGGVTERNFADVLDWWKSQLGELADFFQRELPPAAPAPKNRAS
jgi:hypothetical protein